MCRSYSSSIPPMDVEALTASTLRFASLVFKKKEEEEGEKVIEGC